jgi:hypothetical protein
LLSPAVTQASSTTAAFGRAPWCELRLDVVFGVADVVGVDAAVATVDLDADSMTGMMVKTVGELTVVLLVPEADLDAVRRASEVVMETSVLELVLPSPAVLGPRG